MTLFHTRRRFAAAGLASAAVLLIACGAADTDDDPVGLSDRDLPTTARELPSSAPPADGEQDRSGDGDGTGQQAAAGDCAAYANSDSWCTDGIGDYDCEGGTGDGPNYAPRGVRVVEPGVDPFDLDRNNDGEGCEVSAPAPPAPPPPPAPPSTDPRFDTCGDAIAAGYGPYRRGQDPEYDWYRDADSDGVVCES